MTAKEFKRKIKPLGWENKMVVKTKKDFIEEVDGLNVSLTFAFSYFNAYESIVRAVENRADEVNLAPSFFSLSAKAFLHGIFMETAKLFEGKNRGYSIEKFLNVCEQSLSTVLANEPQELNIVETTNDDGVTIMFGCSVDKFLRIDCNISDVTKKWKCKLNGLSEKIKNVMGVRDKYYGHIDKTYMNDLRKVLNDFPLSSLCEIKELLDFANEVLNGVRSYLTGIDRDPTISNSGDLKTLLDKVYYSNRDIYGNEIDKDALDKLRYPHQTN